MHDNRIIVLGAGPAGMAAAVTLAEAGQRVLVVDQGAAPGGAVHRAPLPGVTALGLPAHKRRWSALMARAARQAARIEVACDTRCSGVDATGAVLLSGGLTRLVRPRGVILAPGARERVLPRPGWTLPGVVTAGAIQTGLKTTGQPPAGRILLAGSGPFLLAVGAELTALGTPPVAIIEAAQPLKPAALGLPLSYWAEATRYRLRLAAAGVRVLTGARLDAIAPGLVAHVTTRHGRRNLQVDLIGLHDGVASNDTGLGAPCAIPVMRAGDGREVLGARAAMLDGTRAGLAMLATLAGQPIPKEPTALIRQRRAQARLARLYAHDETDALNALPQDTILCRCEGRTKGDLDALGRAPTARDLRLTGRFGMGACQGRFCAEWVAHFSKAPDLGRPRLPLRPIAIADLLAVPTTDIGD
jgi:hypothetical protein